MNELMARIALSTRLEPGDERIGLAIREFGPIEVATALRSGRGVDVGCSQAAARWDNRVVWARVEAEMVAAEKLGVRFIMPGSIEWPRQLDDLGDRAPVLLRCLGSVELRLAAINSVGIVGARACTRYGAWVAETIAAELAAAGHCVVSGGAFGIDAAAHSGALAADGSSIAVSAGGVEAAIPRSNHGIFAAVKANGVVVSEMPIGSVPSRHHFLIRNRLIAALSRLLLIVEAGERSGTNRTVSEALVLGRPVGAVPGPVTSMASTGCHSLLRERSAVLIRNGSDVCGLICPRPEAVRLSSTQAEVAAMLARRSVSGSAVTAATLAAEVEMAEPELVSVLVELQASGLVRYSSRGWEPTSSLCSTA